MVLRGAYCLCIKVDKETIVEVGALGRILFEPGKYVYVGSALNGLESRIRRHVNTSRNNYRAVHWHIDYLLREPGISIEEVYLSPSDRRIECAIAEAVSRKGHPIRGFGCSDCRCESHLFKLDGGCVLSAIGLIRKPPSHFL